MQLWNCGRFRFEIGARTLIMGIVNATPDSFSGDGTLSIPSTSASTCTPDELLERSLQHALFQIEAGADILDIGGESTRPGASPVSEEEELRRVIPLIGALRERNQARDVALSIDTTKASVARAAIEAGADIVNDISGATFDPAMLPTLAGLSCGVILMHLRGDPQSMNWSQKQGGGNDVIEEVKAFWHGRIEAARVASISDERIALDAGFGFGKSVEENLELIRRGRELRIGFPVLSATSRKSTIGKILGGSSQVATQERAWGTASTVALAIANGADIVRVHDVREMKQVAQIADAIVYSGA